MVEDVLGTAEEDAGAGLPVDVALGISEVDAGVVGAGRLVVADDVRDVGEVDEIDGVVGREVEVALTLVGADVVLSLPPQAAVVAMRPTAARRASG